MNYETAVAAGSHFIIHNSYFLIPLRREWDSNPRTSSVIRFQDERNRPLCHLSTANFTRPSQGRQRLFWPRQGNRRVGQSLSHGSGIDIGLLAGQVAVAGWTAKRKALFTLLSRCMPYDPRTPKPAIYCRVTMRHCLQRPDG